MLFLNFSHPLNAPQLEQLAGLLGSADFEVIEVAVHFDDQLPFAAQVLELVAAIPLTARAWQTESLIVNLPGLNTIAAILLTELHARSGHFPSIVRLAPAYGEAATTYRVVEIINLQAVRGQSRAKRF